MGRRNTPKMSLGLEPKRRDSPGGTDRNKQNSMKIEREGH